MTEPLWTTEKARDAFGPFGRLILTDWANCDAHVTLTLRSGVQLSGRVRKRGAGDPTYLVSLVDRTNTETKHEVLLSEVAAITAVAT